MLKAKTAVQLTEIITVTHMTSADVMGTGNEWSGTGAVLRGGRLLFYVP